MDYSTPRAPPPALRQTSSTQYVVQEKAPQSDSFTGSNAPERKSPVGAGTKLDRDGTKLESEGAEGAFFEGCMAAASQEAGA